tara:strand:+ start:19503 stop:20255 length:753 start_codon:yes stop_codon:yes gene_type:complete
MQITWRSFVALVLAVVSTYLCIKFQIVADMPTGLFGMAVVFPIVFMINSAYTRREEAFQYYGGLKAGLASIYFAHHNYRITGPGGKTKKQLSKKHLDEMKELKEQLEQFLELIKEDLSNPSSAHDWRQNIYSLHGQITAKNDQVPMSAIDFWSNDILSAYHKLSFISNYRTPRAMKGYSKVFINIFPLCFGPYFAFVDSQVPTLGYAVASLYAIILFMLSAIQDQLENPFDGVGLDDIDLDEENKFTEAL